MRLIYKVSLGLDLHKKQITAHLRVQRRMNGKIEEQSMKFGTMPDDLLALREFITTNEVQVVSMESTSVYWMHLYGLLEGLTHVIVANAAHVKNVPGRKTDVSDAAWLADLGAHGLLRPSFIPPKEIRQLRMLTRYRTKLVGMQTAVRNRTIKLLERAGIKLSSVISDCFGVTGRAVLDALAEPGPINFEACATAKLRPKIAELRRSIGVNLFDAKQRQLLKMHLRDYDSLDAQIAVVEKELAEQAKPYEAEIGRLDEIPGVNTLGAITLIAETGVDMSVFRSAAHLTVLAGVAPGNSVSADKRRRISVRKGNKQLKRILVQIAWAASRKNNSFLRARFLRQQFRLGRPKAIVALARHILVIVYHVLSGDTYRDFLQNPKSEQVKQRTMKNLVRRLESLGMKVTLTPESA